MAGIFLSALLMSGCVKESNLTVKQSNAVAEYMAGLLLKYDRNYDQKLIDIEELTNDETNIVTAAPTQGAASQNTVSSEPSTDSKNNSEDNYTLTDVIGNKNFAIDYSNYKFTNTYPEDTEETYFTLIPRNGYQLLVLSFNVKNITAAVKTFNLSEDNIGYKLYTNSNTVYKPLLTLLENDMQYINIKVGTGKTKTILLVFEISKNTDTSKMKLVISKNKKSETIKIK
jgi:hypothetical protein